VFEGGAGLDQVRGPANPDHDFTVEWTLTIQTEPEAQITITDGNGQPVFSGSADDTGKCAVPLAQYIHQATGKTMLTPHTLTVEKQGRTATKTVRVQAAQTVEIPLGGD